MSIAKFTKGNIAKLTKENIAKFIGTRCSVNTASRKFLDYARIIDTKEYAVFERPIKGDYIVAAYGDVVVKRRGNTLIYIPNARVPFINYKIKLCNRILPDLIPNSNFMQCLLLPYLRVVKQDTYVKDIRLCIFTDKGQIYHNKPSREKFCDGFSKPGDVIRFEESVIWDLPDRKHPTNSVDGDACECYYPGLPEHCYTYSPCINSELGFHDLYGNGGFGKSKEVFIDGKKKLCTRFYQYSRTLQSNAFRFIGTGFKNDKMNLVATYCSNVEEGVRSCIFATSDGGRQWYCKYEFSDTGEYPFQQGHSGVWGTNFGNKIKIDENVDCSYNNVTVYKRKICLPKIVDGNVNTKFEWYAAGKVTAMEKNDTVKIVTEKPHGLTTGNIIALHCIDQQINTINWMLTEKLDENGNHNGFQFKIKVLDKYSFEIYELVSSDKATLPCRHIHHINTLKDGWIVGTGEIYPNGWLLYVQQKKADTYSIVDASEELIIRRINTGRNSVQRTMGALLSDSPDSSLIYASDHDTLERNSVNDSSLSGISRSSIGVFVGKLDDIDDRNSFKCVYEAYEPCYYFQKLCDMLVFTGQRGEIAVCFDPNYHKWYQEHLESTIMFYYGSFRQYHIFNDYVLLRK